MTGAVVLSIDIPSKSDGGMALALEPVGHDQYAIIIWGDNFLVAIQTKHCAGLFDDFETDIKILGLSQLTQF